MKEKRKTESSSQVQANRNAFIDSIIEQSPPQNQDTEKPVDCDYDSKLSDYIKQQRLTDSLELLENVGYYNELAIFVLRTFQVFGGAAS